MRTTKEGTTMFLYFVIGLAIMLFLTLIWVEQVVKRANELSSDCIIGFTWVFIFLVIADIFMTMLMGFNRG